jgi:hypothetical protein
MYLKLLAPTLQDFRRIMLLQTRLVQCTIKSSKTKK